MGLVLIATLSLTVSFLENYFFFFAIFIDMMTGYIDSWNTGDSTNTGMGNKSTGNGSDTGSTTMGGDDSTNSGSSGINAGPHGSKMANKMDPRVDSDLGKLKFFYW